MARRRPFDLETQDFAGTKKDLGAAMQHLRGFHTQAELAAKAGLTRAAWSLYETGRRRPNHTNLVRIVRALNTTRDRLEEVAWAIRRRRLLAARCSRESANRPAGVPETRDPLLVLLERIAAALEAMNSAGRQ